MYANKEISPQKGTRPGLAADPRPFSVSVYEALSHSRTPFSAISPPSQAVFFLRSACSRGPQEPSTLARLSEYRQAVWDKQKHRAEICRALEKYGPISVRTGSANILNGPSVKAPDIRNHTVVRHNFHGLFLLEKGSISTWSTGGSISTDFQKPSSRAATKSECPSLPPRGWRPTPTVWR